MKTASWVIIERATENVIFETFNQNIVNWINLEKYKAVPILEYLVGLNKKIKEDNHVSNI